MEGHLKLPAVSITTHPYGTNDVVLLVGAKDSGLKDAWSIGHGPLAASLTSTQGHQNTITMASEHSPAPFFYRASCSRKKIFVGGLNTDTTKGEWRLLKSDDLCVLVLLESHFGLPCALADSLVSHFRRYGEVEDAEIVLNHVSSKSRGFGFITFTNSGSLDRAIHAGTYQVRSTSQTF